MQHLDAGKVDDESGRYDDSALILSGQHQVIEQLVDAAVGLVGFQRGDKSAHAAPPPSSSISAVIEPSATASRSTASRSKLARTKARTADDLLSCQVDNAGHCLPAN